MADATQQALPEQIDASALELLARAGGFNLSLKNTNAAAIDAEHVEEAIPETSAPQPVRNSHPSTPERRSKPDF